MIKEIIIPKLGETMEEGYLVSWRKEEGDNIEQGDVLFEVMSDKTNFDVEAQMEGVLRKKLYEPGDDPIPVTTVIGYIADSMDEPLPEATKEDQPTKQEKDMESADKPASEKSDILKNLNTNTGEESGRIKISPLARKLSEENGIDISVLKGTGPGGRIDKNDVLQYLKMNSETAGGSDADEYEIKEWTPLRKIIAKRLTESKQQIPHYYFQGKFIVEQLWGVKDYMKKIQPDITFTDFIIYIAAKALSEYPLVNAALVDNRVMVYKSIDVALAIAVPDGLVVPVIRDCAGKDIKGISKERRALIAKSKENRLTDKDMKNARFVISNLGMYGVENFQPIISPPGTAIMGVGAVEKIPVVVDNRVEIKSILNVSFSFDHRVIDGAYAGLFYRKFKELMENPAIMAF